MRASRKLEQVPERLLARLWRQRSRGALLRTQNGQKVQVLYPGRPAPGVGPDFRDALLRLGGRLVRGDVELHRRAAGWWEHAHNRDSGYNGVVLHGVGDASPGGVTLAADGSVVPTVSLRPLARRDGQLVEASLPKVLPTGGLAALLDRAGRARFREHSAAFTRRYACEGVEQAIYASLLEGLGYKENREPFRELARRVPVALLRSVVQAALPGQQQQALEELLLSGSGLREPGPLWYRFVGATPLTAAQWRRVQTRPANHPVRRLRGAAVLLSRFVAAGLLPSLTSLVRQGHARLLPKAFGVADPASPGGALIGESRAADLVVNTVLPAVHAAARSRGSRRLEAACRHLYEAFPPPSGE